MKKIHITTVLFLMLLSVPVSAGRIFSPYVSSAKTCSVSGCDRPVTEKSTYCAGHKCSSRGCTSKRLSGGIYCATHQSKYNKNVRNSYGGAWHGSTSRSSKSSFDPDDHDIESYYDDYRDEYDDYDDAYDGFCDDEDAWDDY